MLEPAGSILSLVARQDPQYDSECDVPFHSPSTSLRRKHRVLWWGDQDFPDTVLYGRLGLSWLPGAPYRLRRLLRGEGARSAGCGRTARPVR